MSRSPSFAAALRETFRAAFAGDSPESEAEVFGLCKEQRFQEAVTLLTAHPRLWHAADEGGRSLLHWGALGGSVELVQGALQARLAVDCLSTDAHSPLMWAVTGGHTAVVHLLLEALADASVKDLKGANLLTVAAQCQQHDVMRLLGDRFGASLEDGDNQGCTAAHWAAYMGDQAALELLHELRMDLQAKDKVGMIPLHRAVSAGQAQVVEFLVEQGADLLQCSADGSSCLELAKEKGDASMQARLVTASMKPILTTRSSGAGSPKEDGNWWHDAAHVITVTPLAIGAAVISPTSSDTEGIPPPDTGADLAASIASPAEESTSHGAAFEVQHCGSLDEFLTEVLEAVEAKAWPRTGRMVCLLIVDCHGAVVDVLSTAQALPGVERFPLRVQPVTAQDVSPNKLATWRSAVTASVTGWMRRCPEKFHDCVFSRIPPQFRWPIWKHELGRLQKGGGAEDTYDALRQSRGQWAQLISIDLRRAFADAPQLLGADQQQEALAGVLNGYAALNPEVGYCQGMHLTAGLLFVVSDYKERETFAVLAQLIDGLGLAEYYREGFPLLRAHLARCEELMEQHLPELGWHFSNHSVDLTMYLQKWLLTLFVECLPLPVVLTLWDAIICQGLGLAPFIAVAIVSCLKETLLRQQASGVARVFKLLRSGGSAGDAQAFAAGHIILEQAQIMLEAWHQPQAPGVGGSRSDA